METVWPKLKPPPKVFTFGRNDNITESLKKSISYTNHNMPDLLQLSDKNRSDATEGFAQK